jgi:iron complex transport system substrate-binding protein
MVDIAGGSNTFGDQDTGTFKLEWEDVVERQPDIIVMMPCGFDVKRGLEDVPILAEREGWKDLPAVRNDRVYVVDASAYFSRSGPRLVNGLEIMAEILHPEIFTGLVPQGGAARLYGQVF